MSPVMNCDDISPLTVYRSPFRAPDILTLSPDGLSMVTPFCSSISNRGPMGLSASLPFSLKAAGVPFAAHTGSIKRYVDPLSRQSSSGDGGREDTGVIRKRPPFFSIPAPSARRHSAVASMSSELPVHIMSQGMSENAASISSLCANDFDGIESIVPPDIPGNTVAFMVFFQIPSLSMAAASSGLSSMSGQSPMERKATTVMLLPMFFLSDSIASASSSAE